VSKTCPDCGETFENLGLHTTLSGCEYPDLSDEQINIIIGTLMGDAHIRPDGMYELCVKQKSYIEFVEDKLPDWFTTKSGTHPVYEDLYDSKNMWRLRTVSTDETKQIRDVWYSDGGGKRFPLSDISLNSTILAHWYATDGGVDSRGRPCFYSSNESTEELRDWLKSEGYDCCCDKNSIRMNKDGERKLFKQTSPISGYGYKWKN